jgi:hypothetical protein
MKEAPLGYRLIRLAPRLAALLAALAIIPWVLGVPGVANSDYARGWTLGFFSLFAYVGATALLAFLGWLAGRGRMPFRAQLAERLLWFALGAFAVAQLWAWFHILR